MTDKEIIKALECCANATHKDCKNCPLFVVDGCVKTMSINALDLINRLQAENERLKYQVNRLKNYDERRDIDLHSRLIANARAETIKEFISCATDLCYKEFENDLEVAHTFASILTKSQEEMVGEE